MRTSGHTLDWDVKPFPFKVYTDTPAIELPRTFDDYLAGLSARTRQSARRKLRRFAKRRGGSVRCFRAPHEVEAFLELNFGFFGRPMSVFGDYVTNLDADEHDTGYAFGVKSGKAKKPGSWDFSVIYQDLQADAVLGLLTDSDFGGGGTNARGYILNAGYAFRENLNAQFT